MFLGRRPIEAILEGDSNAETESQRIIALSDGSALYSTAFVYHLVRWPEIKLHEQARQRIERLITDRALKPGSQLSTETNLASELYVSRTTIAMP